MDDCGLKQCRFEVLNLCQIFDVLRAAVIARLAAVEQDQPYIVPMHFQMEVDGQAIILHLTSRAEGRKMRCLNHNERVCVEIERETCVGIDTVIASGRAMVQVDDCAQSVRIRVLVGEISGRRYFRHD